MAFLASGSEHTMNLYLHEPSYTLNLRIAKIGRKYRKPRSGIEERSECQQIDESYLAGYISHRYDS